MSWGVSFAQEPPALLFRDKEFTNSTIVNNKSNVCDRYRQLYWGQIDLPDALRELHLSVVLIDYQEPITQALYSDYEMVSSRHVTTTTTTIPCSSF
jgi:hypothetical protein